jgi:hypothetical protein
MVSSLSFSFTSFLACTSIILLLPSSIVEAFTTNTNINTINNNIYNIHHPATTTPSSRQQQRQRQQQQLSSSSTSRSRLILQALPNGYKEFGERIIREAAIECGMVFEGNDNEDNENDDDNEKINTIKNKLDIEWKAGSIIVTVHGDVLLSAIPIEHAETEVDADADADDDEDVDADADVNDDETTDLFDDSVDDDEESNEPAEEEEEEPVVDENSRGAIDIALLARTINRMLDPLKPKDENENDSEDNENNGIVNIGLAIAEVHSIEVTTPGVSDDLMILVKTNPSILNVYKGFEVLIQQEDKKTIKKAKTKQKLIEGRLVSYNSEFTIININGRMKTIRNDTIISMKLPKAKKEKGTR